MNAVSPRRSNVARLGRRAAALAIGLCVGLAVTPTAAQAITVGVSGSIYADKSLTQYNTFREKVTWSTTSLNMTGYPACTWSLAIGLRNSAGTQISKTVTWTAGGSKVFTTSSGGLMPPARYAFNARADATGDWYCNGVPLSSMSKWRDWSGSYTY
jgi:hypothetical protein